jgi:hypothetical protein
MTTKPRINRTHIGSFSGSQTSVYKEKNQTSPNFYKGKQQRGITEDFTAPVVENMLVT